VRALLAALAVLAVASPAQAARSTVSFSGLSGVLQTPKTTGKHSAVVLLHGCSGMFSDSGALQGHIDRWLRTLARRGHVALAVDSFTPRGVEEVCDRDPEETGVSEVTDRVRDAFTALGWLRTRPDVRRTRVAALGWSNGGSTVLSALGKHGPVAPPRGGGFRAGVAFYPGCGLRGAFPAYAPRVRLALFTASLDPLAPDCAARRGPRLLSVREFAGAQHSFDNATIGTTTADRRARRTADRLALRLLRKKLR
jgi:dienelactone hydrolase